MPGKVKAGEDSKRPRGHKCYRNIYYEDKYIQYGAVKLLILGLWALGDAGSGGLSDTWGAGGW